MRWGGVHRIICQSGNGMLAIPEVLISNGPENTEVRSYCIDVGHSLVSNHFAWFLKPSTLTMETLRPQSFCSGAGSAVLWRDCMDRLFCPKWQMWLGRADPLPHLSILFSAAACSLTSIFVILHVK